MSTELPKRLVLSLGLIAVASFTGSMYLDWFHPGILQAHPISANLISGLTGFSTGTLVVAIGFNWIRKRGARAVRKRIFDEIRHRAKQLQDIDSTNFVTIGNAITEGENLAVLILGYLNEHLKFTPKAVQEPHRAEFIRTVTKNMQQMAIELRELSTMLFGEVADHLYAGVDDDTEVPAARIDKVETLLSRMKVAGRRVFEGIGTLEELASAF